MKHKNIIIILTYCLLYSAPGFASEYYTEYFYYGGFDLNGKSMTFTPDGSTNFYSVSGAVITNLPTEISEATGVIYSGLDDGFNSTTLNDGKFVPLYGTDYDTVHVGSNGYLTFGLNGDRRYTPSITNHFALPRISLFYTDLDTRPRGEIRYEQQDDRFVVMYQDVPHYSYNTNLLCSAQCEIFYNGTIRLSWIDITPNYGNTVIVGLSNGDGTPPDFSNSDLSSLLVDLDNDDIPDTWEVQYFSTRSSCDPADDSDSDGFDNLAEYIAGTVPTNSASFFKISDINLITQPDARFVINWNAVEGRTYSIKWKDTLDSSFSSLATLSFPQNSYTSTIESAQSQGFIQLEVQIAP